MKSSSLVFAAAALLSLAVFASPARASRVKDECDQGSRVTGNQDVKSVAKKCVQKAQTAPTVRLQCSAAQLQQANAAKVCSNYEQEKGWNGKGNGNGIDVTGSRIRRPNLESLSKATPQRDEACIKRAGKDVKAAEKCRGYHPYHIHVNQGQ